MSSCLPVAHGSLCAPQPEKEGNAEGESKPGSGVTEQSGNIDNTEAAAHSAQYSVYTIREKRAIIAMAGFTALLSPLTATSYLPAILIMADAFNTTVELINVTVTVYMIVQGLSPMIWGSISDRIGRRPMFLTCMAILCFSCIGLALVPKNAYWLLIVLRCLQAAGSASTVALASGTVSDIAEPGNRGEFVGLSNFGLLIGPSFGPIIGGLFADHLGWRSIFWFLAITAGVYFTVLLLVFPETLRVIVGDGSVPSPPINRPLLSVLTKYDPSSIVTRPPPKKFINPLLQFTQPSVTFILLFNGMVCAVFYGVTATLSTLFSEAYPYLTESEIGLCFLAIGIGGMVGSFVNGKLLDANFKRVKDIYNKRKKAEEADEQNGQEPDLAVVEADFPIEYARLRMTPLFLCIFVLSNVGYGWSVQRTAHISCPLILQFIIGWTSMSILNTSQTLLMDLFPAQGSSIAAANNLIRCTMGAALVSVVDFILHALCPGWTYVLLGGLCVLLWPLTLPIIKYGPRWRARQKAKDIARCTVRKE